MEGRSVLFIYSCVSNVPKICASNGNEGKELFEFGVWLFKILEHDVDLMKFNSNNGILTQLTLAFDLHCFLNRYQVLETV